MLNINKLVLSNVVFVYNVFDTPLMIIYYLLFVDLKLIISVVILSVREIFL